MLQLRKCRLCRPTRRFYSTNPNQQILDLLKTYRDKENKSPLRDGYKVRAFAHAMKSVQDLSIPIRSVDEIRQVCGSSSTILPPGSALKITYKLKGIGPGIAARIEAFLAGQEYDVEEYSPEARKQALIRAKQLASLRSVPSIGPKKAEELVDAGCTTITDMAKPEYQKLLTKAQKTQYRYFGHLQTPITRSEAESVADFIRDNISSDFDVTLVGSYRRGASASPSIDILLHHPSHVHIPEPSSPPDSNSLPQTRHGRKSIAFRVPYSPVKERSSSILTKEAVKPLSDRGLIATPVTSGVHGAHRWQGIIRLPERPEHGGWGDRGPRLRAIRDTRGMFRNMDLNLAPLRCRGAALLTLTGDSEFKRDIQARAVGLGLKLNEFGLWRWKGPDPLHDSAQSPGFWELLQSESEEEILKELGMDYVPPEKRNFDFVFKR